MYQLQHQAAAAQPVDLVEMHIVDGLSQCKSFREVAEEIVQLLKRDHELDSVRIALTDA
jgi:hypothetical protein